MLDPGTLIQQLFSIRNQFGKEYIPEKIRLLQSIEVKSIKNKKAIKLNS